MGIPKSSSNLTTKSGRLYVSEDPTGDIEKGAQQGLDRFLACFAPWARLIIVAVPYYAAAALMYTSFQTKACESTVMLSEPNYDPATCRESWTIIDSVYFATVSMSTVGYGDLTVQGPVSRLFTAVWIIIGVVTVFGQISGFLGRGIASLTEWTLASIDKILGGTGEVSEEDRESSEPLNFFWFYLKGMSVGIIYFVIFQAILSVVILSVDPDLGYTDVLWYCFITATTVGYGDVNVHSQLGRLFATFHVLMSVVWLAAIIGHLSALIERRNRQLRHAEMLRRRLDPSLLSEMDHDGENGVDKVEFVVETLIHLGAELGGEPLNWGHVEPILGQFAAFDVDDDGVLTYKDLKLLSELRGAIVGKATATKTRTTRDLRQFGRQATFVTPPAPSPAAAPPTKQWDDGTTYEGDFEDGVPCGQGTTTWPDGSAYEGEHKDGRPHGHGTCRFSSGGSYVGGMQLGFRHGHGVLSYASGARWEGEWQRGLRHGQGVAYSADGKQQEQGEWKNDERVKTWGDERIWRDEPTRDVAKGMAMGAAALRAQSMAAANFAAKGAQKAVRIVPFVGD